MKHNNTLWIIVYMYIFITITSNGCSGGLTVQYAEIRGPDSIYEYKSVEFSIEIEGGTGVSYQWLVEPVYAGEFTTPNSAISVFTAGDVLIDSAVEVIVVVTTEQKDAMKISKELLIMNRSGWVKTWDYLRITDFSVDSDDNIYCIGTFTDGIDLDPSIEIDWHISIGDDDAFLVKISSEGDFQWGCSWGGEFDDGAYTLAICDSGIYVTGYYSDIVDFNPGDGSNLHISNGFGDGFLSKFDLNGEYLWTCTWGSENKSEIAGGIVVDKGNNVYVTMNLPSTFDLDPGVGVDIRVLKGYEDSAMIKLDQDGNYLWAKTWGG